MVKEKNVIVIKANGSYEEPGKLKVAAYCRVSSNSEDQINSFSAQLRYYDDFIRSREDMIFVDIYADEGITGTSTAKRDEFNRMIKDSKNGKIDVVYVKSVSRFARNALDCLEYIRILKKQGTNVFFENDGISTESMESELILYIKSAFAESESLATSRRVSRSYQMRMELGEVTFKSTPFGYVCINNMLIPKPEEAEIVKEIYNYYLSGMGIGKIVQELNLRENDTGKPWTLSKVHYILCNEKYIGDSLLQKCYTPHVLPFKCVKNKGEVDQYYVQNTHEAILDKETYYAVQEMMKRNIKKYSLSAEKKQHKFTGKIYCSDCGWAYKKKYNSGVPYWTCSKNGQAGQRCSTHPIKEEYLERTFCNFYNRLKQNENEILRNPLNRLEIFKTAVNNGKNDIRKIDEDLLKLQAEKSLYFKLFSSKSIDEATYMNIVNETANKIASLNSKRKKITVNDEDEGFLDELRKTVKFLETAPDTLIEYNHTVFENLVEKIMVEEKTLIFCLKCGLNLRECMVWN